MTSTAQNSITWWNQPSEAKMAQSASKHIKTAEKESHETRATPGAKIEWNKLGWKLIVRWRKTRIMW